MTTTNEEIERMNWDGLGDQASPELLLRLAAAGNWAAHRAALEKRKGIELVLSSYAARLVLGTDGVQKLWEKYWAFNDRLGKIQPHGCTPQAKLADLDQLLNEMRKPNNP